MKEYIILQVTMQIVIHFAILLSWIILKVSQ